MQFPAGKELDKLAHQAVKREHYTPKTDGFSFSLSGVEHKMKQRFEAGEAPEELAYFAIASVIAGVQRVTRAARAVYGDIPVLYSGGVASNSLLRQLTPDGLFAEPRYSTDNAMGSAILTYRTVKANGTENIQCF